MAKHLRLLIVEDSESDAALAVRLLSKAGYAVRSRRVETAEEMGAALREMPWDLVIADYRLPRFDAPGALDVLQQTGLDVPFIVVSGVVGEDTAVAMMKAGTSDYLMKDRLARLAPAVERELREAEVRQERRSAERANLRLLESLRAINELAIELGGLQSPERIRAIMAERLLQISGAVAVVVSSYDEATKALVVEHAAFPPGHADLRQRVEAALGAGLIGLRVPVSVQVEQEGAFGSMPHAISSAVERELQSGELYALVLADSGQLLGTCVIVMPRTAEAVPEQVRSMLARVCSVALSRATAEEDLRASEARFSTVFHASPNPVALTRLADGTLVDINDAGTKVIGYARAEAIGKTPVGLNTWVEPLQRDRLVELVRARGEVQGFELRLRPREGPSRDLLVSAATIDIGGEPCLLTMAADITERKRAEEQYRELIENLNDVVFALDLDGTVRFASPAVRTNFGCHPANIVGRPYDELVHPEDANAVRASFERTMAGDLRPSEFRLRTASGEYRWVRTSSRPTLDGERVVGLSGVLTDMTERRQAEQAARTSEAQLAAALRLAHLGHWEYDVGKALFTFNDHFYALLRTTAEREGGYTMPAETYTRRFLPPDEAGLVASEVRKALESTDSSYAAMIEHKVIFGDGQPGYLAVRIFVVKDDQGRTVRTYGVDQDVTERRTAEEALRVSEERLRGVFQAAVDGILVADSETGHFVMANQTICDMLGYSENELLRLSVKEIHPAEALPMVMEAFRNQVAGLDSLAPSVPVRRRDGTTFIADINAVPLVMGGQSCLLGVIRDMTAIKELEAQVRQAQKMEAVGRLAGGVAHDFNNILGVVLGHCELALKRLRPDDPLHGNLKQILSGAERGAALTRQLLAFSHQQPLSPALLDLTAVVRNLTRMLERLLGEDVELVLDLGEGLRPIHADPGQVEQVVINLAVNARDAMPGGGRLVIATGEHVAMPGPPGVAVDGAGRPALVLTVTDTGHGMDETTKQHLFEPFFTTKAVGKGTGLGLSTVYGIVEQAGGHIELESERGQGTTFRVILPSAETTAAVAPAAVSRRPEEGHGETILVVEDEQGLRELVQDLIQELGYAPVVAANGGEALLAVEEQQLRPDVLITDVIMPGMNGTILADRLRRTLPDLKVLFMSGYTDVEDRTDEGRGGLQNLLHKPFHASDLANAIHDLLRGASDSRAG